MTKQERKFKSILSNKNFDKKYLKNIIIDVAHGQSTVAHTESCSICGLKAHKKGEKYDSRSYGISLGQFYNKRHKTKNTFNPQYPRINYFTDYVCSGCVRELELALDFSFIKSYAP